MSAREQVVLDLIVQAAQRGVGQPAAGDIAGSAIVNWRMIHGHGPNQHYLTRRRANPNSEAEIRRCLKRYTARHLFHLVEVAAPLDKP